MVANTANKRESLRFFAINVIFSLTKAAYSDIFYKYVAKDSRCESVILAVKPNPTEEQSLR